MRSLISFLCLVCSVLCFPENALSAPSKANPKIIVIGAGPAGIAAATKLLENGFNDVTVLEAEKRIGGRIHTIPFGDNFVDMGAQWCHGEKNNVVFELMKDQNVFGSSEPLLSKTVYIRSNGEHLTADDTIIMENIINQIASKRLNLSMPIQIAAPEFFEKQLDTTLKESEYTNVDREVAAEVIANYEKEECILEACDDAREMPAVGDREYQGCEGDQTLTWKDKGYKTLLNFLMKTHELGNEYGVLQDHIRLSKTVKAISWKRNNKVFIKCDDGEEILADHVIITVSLGVLKANNAILFEPPLPQKKQEAIDKIQFGAVGKIFLEFEQEFWTENFTGFAVLWTQQDLADIRNTENNWWLEGIVSFYAVEYQPRLMEVWLVGPSVRYMETLSDNEVKIACIEMLKRFLRHDIPEPVNIVKSDWHKNPNFRGTYSYHSITTFEAHVGPRNLQEPLKINITDCNEIIEKVCDKPIVLFAGEATNAEHYSTVHGAVESGWREANRLNDFYLIA